MMPGKRPEVGDMWIMNLDDPKTGLEKELLVYLAEDLTDDCMEPTFWAQIGRNEQELSEHPIEKAMTESMILERCYQIGF